MYYILVNNVINEINHFKINYFGILLNKVF